MSTPETILIVDDSENDRWLFRRYIENAQERNYRILEAENLNKGLEIWRSQKPDVALVDFNLTDGNGLEFLEAIQADICTDSSNNCSKGIYELKLPVIMLTGHGDEKIAVNAMKLGASDYLVKNDITEFSLCQSIHSLIERTTLSRKFENLQKRESLVAQIALNIRQFLNLEDICHAMAQEVRRFLKADRTVIYKFNADMSRQIISEALVEPWLSCLNFISQDICFSQLEGQLDEYRAGKLLIASDIHNANFTECHRQMLESFQVRANVVVPILLSEHLNHNSNNLSIHNESLWGLLIIHQCSATRVWEDWEIQFLKQLCVQLAIAIQQAQLYQNLQSLKASLETQVQERTCELRFSEARFQKIAKSSPGAIQIFVQRVDSSAYFEYMSAAFEEINELPVEQILINPQLCFDQIHVDDIADFWEALGSCLETLSPLHHEWRIITPSGKVKWVKSYSRLEQRENGDIAWYGVVLDISDRKHIELALAKEKEVAESANKAKSEFLANMSHEIRTPMNGVLGMAQLLANTPLREDQKNFVQVILDSGDILLTVINDILDFSKVESGNLQLEKKEFNFSDIINSVGNLLRKQALDKNIHLQYQVDDDLPSKVIGDSSRLRQIFINLINNAIKFTKHGFINIKISGKFITSTTYEFRFSIADTGIGIDSEQINNLFKPFTQADASINRQFGGTGLGLAICKRLIELMGGTIWVESRGHVGGHPPLDWVVESSNHTTQGSTFHFMMALPVISADHTSKKIDSAIPIELESLSKQHPIKILLVEDNILNQKITSLMLQKLGYQADIVNNGFESVAVLSNQKTDQKTDQEYDLVFMNVQMPIMDGITATRIIRENSSSKDKPWIIALTADVLPEDQQAYIDAGMNDYISKPINIKAIERSLSEYSKRVL